MRRVISHYICRGRVRVIRYLEAVNDLVKSREAYLHTCVIEPRLRYQERDPSKNSYELERIKVISPDILKTHFTLVR